MKEKEVSKSVEALKTTNIDEIKGKSPENKSKEKFKDKKSRSKSKSKSKSNKGKENFREKSNDPSWYVANQSIVRDVANIPFAVFNGIDYHNFNQWSGYPFARTAVSTTHVPGVAIYKYTPWYGTSTPTSSLNLTMRALYSFVRHANSGRSNYEAPDLMLYIMAMDSVYLMIHEIKRIIRLAYHYNLENRDIPEKILLTMGVDVADLVSNLANYRAALNVRIAKANSLAVPTNFNLFKRRAVMGSVVLTDEPNRPTQLIVPQADGFYKYNPRGNSGGKLDYVVNGDPVITMANDQNDAFYGKQPMTLDRYLTLLDDLLAVLLSDEDINIMSGDIIKAYGNDLYTIPFLQADEIQEIIHDQDLLLQFTNSIVLDLPCATLAVIRGSGGNKTFDVNLTFTSPGRDGGSIQRPIITQDNGSLVAEANLHLPLNDKLLTRDVTMLNAIPFISLDNPFLDTSEAKDISPENIMEWSRLTMTAIQTNSKSEDPNAERTYILEAGVEIGLGWLVGVPGDHFSLAGNEPGTSVPRWITSQWFQFATPTVFEYAIPYNGHNVPVGSYVSHFTIERYAETIQKNILYKKFNMIYTHRMMTGLTFGPRSYWVNGVESPTDNRLSAALVLNASIDKLYEKTAVLSRHNIVALHDAALLGLIASPYITNSK